MFVKYCLGKMITIWDLAPLSAIYYHKNKVWLDCLHYVDFSAGDIQQDFRHFF